MWTGDDGSIAGHDPWAGRPEADDGATTATWPPIAAASGGHRMKPHTRSSDYLVKYPNGIQLNADANWNPLVV